MLLSPNILPHTYQDLSVIMKEIGMQYEEIDTCLDLVTCPNHHIIFYKQHEFETECPECHISRYQTDQLTKNVPRKVLRGIPIIPRFQRLFRCKNIAQFTDYHRRI